MTDVSELGAVEAAEASSLLKGADPERILRWAVDSFQPDLTMACSFGGPTGMVLIDLVTRLGLGVPVFYLDTDYLFAQTHQLIEVTKRRYGIELTAFHSRWSVAEQEESFGAALWDRDPDLCCALRKVEPNSRALEGKRAWIAGLRRDQSASRRSVEVVEWDTKFWLFKINPLAAWTEGDVWDYIKEHDVPYNTLHDQGYPSIGCSNCTRAVQAGEDSRAGRWSGLGKTECGLHLPGQSKTVELALSRGGSR